MMKKKWQNIDYQICNSQNSGFLINLDNKAIRTPNDKLLIVKTGLLARAIVKEWQCQQKNLTLTKLASTIIDSMPASREQIINELIGFINTDLICYRAATPLELAEYQASHWDNFLNWVNLHYGIELITTNCLIVQPQADKLHKKIRQTISAFSDEILVGFYALVTGLGSIIVALALLDRHISFKQGFNACHIDESWSIKHWGNDDDLSIKLKDKVLELRKIWYFIKTIYFTD